MARKLGVLMVCLGNICRSPMAEGVLRARLAEAGLAGGVRVDSAATGRSHIGHAPDERAIACARKHGIDIAAQRARALEIADFDDFFRPLDRELRALPYAGDDLDVTMRVLGDLAERSGVRLHLPRVWRWEDPWA